MGKFKALDIEQQEAVRVVLQGYEEFCEHDFDFDQVMEEMYERNVLQSAAELCRREDYGYSKFLDELHKVLNESRGKEV